MKKIKKCFVAFIVTAFVITGCTDKKEVPAVAPVAYITDKNWQFETTPLWQDDFTAATVEAAKWTFYHPEYSNRWQFRWCG